MTVNIGLSARAMDGDRESALAAGLDDHLTKPLREEQLKASLERWTQPESPPVASHHDVTVDLTGNGLS